MRLVIIGGLSLIAVAIDRGVLGGVPYGLLPVIILAAYRDLVEYKQKKELRALQIIKLEMEIKEIID